jgi:hypothetical protein
MVKPAPVSLKIRAREINAHARRVLENDLAQRRTRAQAVRALAAVYAMRTSAQARLRSLHSGDRDSWESKLRLLETILSRIIRQGIE